MPFTSGFIAKFGVIQAAVEVDSYAIAIIAMVSAVIAAFIYLRIMLTMWTSDPATAADGNAEPIAIPFSVGVAILAAAAFTLVVGIVPGWLIDAADTVTAYAR